MGLPGYGGIFICELPTAQFWAHAFSLSRGNVQVANTDADSQDVCQSGFFLTRVWMLNKETAGGRSLDVRLLYRESWLAHLRLRNGFNDPDLTLQQAISRWLIPKLSCLTFTYWSCNEPTFPVQ
jgi:hypothetical protein